MRSNKKLLTAFEIFSLRTSGKFFLVACNFDSLEGDLFQSAENCRLWFNDLAEVLLRQFEDFTHFQGDDVRDALLSLDQKRNLAEM